MIRRLVTRYWLLLPLLILVVVLLDRVEEPNVVETEDTINMSETRSDYYLSDFRTRRYGNDGLIEYIVEGDTLAHFPAEDRSLITNPRVELRRGAIAWTMQSDTGQFDTTPELFTLQGNVSVKRHLQDSPTPTAIRMTTELLRIETAANRAETDALVQIIAPTWRIEAKGLTTAIDDGQLRLLSDVVGRYQLPDKRDDLDD